MFSAQTFLLTSQSDDGGWGYAPGQASCVEPTAAVLLALRQDPTAAGAVDRGQAWLLSSQHGDGGWGITAGDAQSGWQTAWALLPLASSDANALPAARAVQWLLGVETLVPTEDDMQFVSDVLDIDPTLLGWPWQPSQANWVEPTALSMLALAKAGHGDAPRVAQAVGYLTDRRCRDGGWNVGNPVMFSQPLPPRAHPSAWVLLALARLAPGSVRAEDVEALRAAMLQDGGVPALAWGLLALAALGQHDEPAQERLASLQSSDGSWNANPYHTAVSALALAGASL